MFGNNVRKKQSNSRIRKHYKGNDHAAALEKGK